MKGSDFYFQVINQASGTFFLITPISYYTQEGCLSDESDVAGDILPASTGFYELAESTYQYEGDLETGKKFLIDLGLIQIDFGFHNKVEPEKPNFEEEYLNEDEDELDILLKEDTAQKTIDYTDMSTDKLLRHIKIMLLSESFEEAEKIKVELHSRGETNF
jgi:hypothetical protein